MLKKITYLVSGISLSFLIGCGSGGGGGDSATTTTPPPATVMVKIYYDEPTNTMVHEEGLVLLGPDGNPTTTKHGLWKTYFPPENGNSLETEKIFVDNQWDQQQEWIEYNADTSIRVTMTDGTF
jgi:hypothetical protein